MYESETRLGTPIKMDETWHTRGSTSVVATHTRARFIYGEFAYLVRWQKMQQAGFDPVYHTCVLYLLQMPPDSDRKRLFEMPALRFLLVSYWHVSYTHTHWHVLYTGMHCDTGNTQTLSHTHKNTVTQKPLHTYYAL